MEEFFQKGLGGIFVILGCSGAGFYVAFRYATRIRILKELEQALHYIYGEISYSAPDMAEIMEHLSFRGGTFGEFFLNMRGRILSHQGLRFCEYWTEEMKDIPGLEHLTTTDCEFLQQLGENLGNMDRMTQLNTLQIFQERLSKIIQNAEQEYHGKAKVSVVIGMTIGIFLVILFL